MSVDPWAIAAATVAVLLGIRVAVISRKKDRHSSLGQDPTAVQGAEFIFDLGHKHDRAAAVRSKHRDLAETLQPVIIATSVGAGISTVASLVPQMAIVGIFAGLSSTVLFSLRAERLHREASALIDASTDYLVFYQSAKVLRREAY